MTHFPEDTLEHIFQFLTSKRDRDRVSLVSKSWFKVEGLSRQSVTIGNCYALSPERLVARFPNVRALTLKGRPHFASFDSVPISWGGSVGPWIEALAKTCPLVEQLKLKRMVVSDESLQLLSLSFPYFKSLTLIGCDGFTTDGLAAIATNCRLLEVLDLRQNIVEEGGREWLSCFPESCTSLISLNFAGVEGEVDLEALARLVARCPNLRSLRLNGAVPIDTLQKILVLAPQLVDLGIGSFVQDTNSEPYLKLCDAFLNCKSLRKLSGFLEVAPSCIPAIYPVCSNLTFLNLCYASRLRNVWPRSLFGQCPKLQRLWILANIGDQGLEEVANTCKDLQELRVLPFSRLSLATHLTEKGLAAISRGCPKLRSLLYTCIKMTDTALITVAKQCPNLTSFRLDIQEPRLRNFVSSRPLDEGFGAIVQSCKELRHLSLSGLLTDQVFLYIGLYAERLEMLSATFAGEGDKGMLYVLNGCRNLRKLEIRDSPFGDAALLARAGRFEMLQFTCMSSCEVTLGGCKALAKLVPMLNVEIIDENYLLEENQDNSLNVKKLYLYRTLDGPRKDAPDFVWTL